MENSNRIMFLRAPNGHPVGALAIRLVKGKNTAKYQFSVLNPKDQFDRAVARQLALGRLVEKPLTVHLPDGANMHDISESVMLDLSQRKEVPSRAQKAASLWLNTNGSLLPL